MNEELSKIAKIISEGGIILYPTDTIWGIGCDATNAEAIKKIYKIKQREAGKSMLILVDSELMIEQYANNVPEVAWELIRVSEEPITIIFSEAKNLPVEMVAEDGSIGIRIVNDDFCRQLIRKIKKPLVSTSANFSGKPFPACFDDISEEIKNMVDYVVQHRQSEIMKAKPSPIIKIDKNGIFKIIRH